MITSVEDGKIKIDIESLVANSEAVRREIVKYALFEETVLIAITQFALTQECDWGNPDSAPWWCGGSENGGIKYYKLREKIASISTDVALALIKDLHSAMSRLQEERDVYQSRAWAAERIVKDHRAHIIHAISYPALISEVYEVCSQPPYGIKKAVTA